MKKFCCIILILCLAFNLFCMFYYTPDLRSVLFHLTSALFSLTWLFVFLLTDTIKDFEELNNYNNELIGKYIELVTLQDERKELYEQEIEELKNKLKENNIEL